MASFSHHVMKRAGKGYEARQLPKVKQLLKEETAEEQNPDSLASKSGAGDEIRTHDSVLGKHILYR